MVGMLVFMVCWYARYAGLPGSEESEEGGGQGDSKYDNHPPGDLLPLNIKECDIDFIEIMTV